MLQKLLHGALNVGLILAATYAGANLKYSGVVAALLSAIGLGNVNKAFNTVPPLK